MIGRLSVAVMCAAFAMVQPARAERPPVTPAMRPFISLDAPSIAFTHARVIDGTGTAAVVGQTILVRDGVITAVGPDASVRPPGDAKVVDLAGKSVLPGLVQLHEHLWMSAGTVLSVPVSYPRLLLAGGVTSIRTAGSYNDYIDLRTRSNIEAGRAVGPWMDLSIYMDLFGAPRLKDSEAARKYLNFWLDSGFTSVKAYGYTNKVALKTAVEIAHARGLKITGHLCAVTYGEAAELGIDDIEHGFAMAPDFLAPVSGPPAEDPDHDCGIRALHGLDAIDPGGPAARALIAKLVAHKVAITSTLPALEDLVVDIPPQAGIEMLTPPLQDYHRQYRAKLRQGGKDVLNLSPDSVRKSAVMEREFMQAGGLLVSGTDPAVPSGGVIAGYSNARQLELMVAYGFTPLEAIRVSTLNGATYLGRADRIGSVAAGKQADLLIVEGDPSSNISDIRNVWMVLKQGLGYDPQKLRESVRGRVGLE